MMDQASRLSETAATVLLNCCYPVLEPNERSISKAVLALTNTVRAAHGVDPLVLNRGLMTTAQHKARDMIARKYFDHYDPADGTPVYRTYEAVRAENIGLNYPTVCRAVEGWRRSQSHHDCMINPRLTRLGVGYASKLVAIDGKAAQYFWVQHFN